jgi:hypothetical protein
MSAVRGVGASFGMTGSGVHTRSGGGGGDEELREKKFDMGTGGVTVGEGGAAAAGASAPAAGARMGDNPGETDVSKEVDDSATGRAPAAAGGRWVMDRLKWRKVAPSSMASEAENEALTEGTWVENAEGQSRIRDEVS